MDLGVSSSQLQSWRMNCKELQKNTKIQEWQTKLIAQREETADLREKVANCHEVVNKQERQRQTSRQPKIDTLVQRQAPNCLPMQQSSELLQRRLVGRCKRKTKDNTRVDSGSFNVACTTRVNGSRRRNNNFNHMESTQSQPRVSFATTPPPVTTSTTPLSPPQNGQQVHVQLLITEATKVREAGMFGSSKCDPYVVVKTPSFGCVHKTQPGNQEQQLQKPHLEFEIANLK
eukprot:TRINITY_DN67854_c0_g1_i7.p2 TRINITY_DN67854_c0_g1~~TRINITY_DN67854_c0_g1_i7.p2  ORF type:complete len:231 (-),score=37.28 TRINITY_DN67854_c0_g1_i7:1397-2089(-)